MIGPPSGDGVRAFLAEAHLELGARLSAFAAGPLAAVPHADSDDEARVRAREILTLLGEGGWLAPIGEMDLRAIALTREAIAWTSPLADAVYALQALGSAPILLSGTDDQKERWAAPALRGKAMAAFVMTEPGAGSDVGAIATTARREGDGYVLDGTKTFISNAGIADFHTVFASTAPEEGHRGLSCFVVPAGTEGLRFVRPLVMSEPHPLGEIAFEGCRIPAANRVGQEGEAFRLGLSVLDRLRPTVAAAACGMAARALDEALDHATEREQFGQPLSGFQLVQEKLARMATELDAARLLTYRAAWLHDQGGDRITLEASQAKFYATEAAQGIVDDAVQILGGKGVMADHPVDRLYRAVRALRIYEGTTEIQHLVIARELLRRRDAEKGGSPVTDGPDPGETEGRE
jgi:acyl-CoA dehydrogenase